ncbi:MAG TPA: NADH-ubiquinone oxidoreductase-F iron-sulfur binding region domain-containing protein [Chloroflexota bacterium]|jgi:NADH-quinone oxidoreductase subunit F|nr:NADH-ubiquinone oxidoreductase-F iron-sulfur binding region domain-containing protein [Chloroflexota bacterium]
MERILLTSEAGPERFADYERQGGYTAWRRAVTEGRPEQVLAEIVASGLRGRGGAAFPVGKKWQIAAETPAEHKYVVCNGGEDEPGSRKDRFLLENYPHKVLEGLLLAAYAVGAHEAILYVNHQYQQAQAALEQALAEARAAGYIGPRACGSDFAIAVRLHAAPSTYVAGEDSAAVNSIEGQPAKPRQKPPYPATAGIHGRPTVVNNVETLANVPAIVRRGAAWFRSIGTTNSPGTMLFTVLEGVKRPGIYELPFGTPLRYLYEACAGGLADDRPLKAILPGGPSSGFLTPDALDLPLDYQAFREAGSALGCGVMTFYPEGTDMVDVVLQIAEFFARESCGQCPKCQFETQQLLRILQLVKAGKATRAALAMVDKVIEQSRGQGWCSLINMPGPPLTSALRLFPEDFARYLTNGGSPAAR